MRPDNERALCIFLEKKQRPRNTRMHTERNAVPGCRPRSSDSRWKVSCISPNSRKRRLNRSKQREQRPAIKPERTLSVRTQLEPSRAVAFLPTPRFLFQRVAGRLEARYSGTKPRKPRMVIEFDTRLQTSAHRFPLIPSKNCVSLTGGHKMLWLAAAKPAGRTRKSPCAVFRASPALRNRMRGSADIRCAVMTSWLARLLSVNLRNLRTKCLLPLRGATRLAADGDPG